MNAALMLCNYNEIHEDAGNDRKTFDIIQKCC